MPPGSRNNSIPLTAFRTLLLFDRLFLARRAVEGAPVSQDDSLDQTVTFSAWLGFAVIDSEMVLKIAKFVVGIPVIRKRSPTPANRLAEDLTGHGGDGRNLPT